MRTKAGLAVMSQINIEVREHHGGNLRFQPLRLQGRVIRHGRTGIGVEWQEFAAGVLAQIIPTGPQIALWAHSAHDAPNEVSFLGP